MLLAFLVDKSSSFVSPYLPGSGKLPKPKPSFGEVCNPFSMFLNVNSFNELFAVLASLYLTQRE